MGAFTAEELTWDMVQNMNLLYNCIKETLRMWPPLLFLMRKLNKDVVRGRCLVQAHCLSQCVWEGCGGGAGPGGGGGRGSEIHPNGPQLVGTPPLCLRILAGFGAWGVSVAFVGWGWCPTVVRASGWFACCLHQSRSIVMTPTSSSPRLCLSPPTPHPPAPHPPPPDRGQVHRARW